ncbi:MAG: membrane protein insertase YidC [Ferruginibacter sp.]
MDRNTLIGFGLIAVLLIAMFAINSNSRKAYEAEQKRIADSVAALKPKVDTTLARLDSARLDTIKAAQQQNDFQTTPGTEQLTVVENELMKISFTNKGGQPAKVELKKFKKYDGTTVLLQEGNFNKFSYGIIAGVNKTAQTGDLFFTAEPVVKNTDGSQSVSFIIKDSSGKQLTHQYVIRPNDYMIDFNISANGAKQLFTQNTVNILWQTEAEQIEKDHKYELTQTHLCFVENKDYDFKAVHENGDVKLDKNVDWVSLKQQFFITGLAAKNKFSSARTDWTVPVDTNAHFLARAVTNAVVTLPEANSASIPLQLYYGPSDYNILKKYGNQMENIVPYGSGIFAFVKYINRYFLLPVFDFLQRNVASMGIVILLLTLLIRLITSPILYKSYLSGAKMKLLKPEVDALKEKYKDDQQAFGMEQMKLWRSAGVSPLGGCLPALLQIPIFMSLYYFFQSNIDLRGKSFLWAADLAQYDSILKLPFSIPIYGDHISLFTITATVTSLLISIYSMSQMQDNSNPVMKYMPYIFPVLLIFVFNNLPSALTWYYTVSNTITLILQVVIQKYIIDHDKIMAQINENRKKPVKKSKMQERIEAMQEAQKKMEQNKSKGNKK